MMTMMMILRNSLNCFVRCFGPRLVPVLLESEERTRVLVEDSPLVLERK